jgi:hypothetical protein
MSNEQTTSIFVQARGTQDNDPWLHWHAARRGSQQRAAKTSSTGGTRDEGPTVHQVWSERVPRRSSPINLSGCSIMTDLFDLDDEAAPGPPAQLPTHEARSVGQPGGMGEEKVGSSPCHPNDDTPVVAERASPAPPWHEVPQPLFDSWGVPRQLAYCAARDEDSATSTYDPEWATFYAARAASYREMIHA